MKIATIILAGGNGTRFGAKKQFLKVKGKELWRHVYDKVTQFIPKEDIVVVGVDIEGGVTRSQSVINGLRELEGRGSDYERLIILEAARPLVTEDQICTAIKDEYPSSTFVLPMINSVITKDGTYIDRDSIYMTTSPEIFDYQLFLAAYTSGKYFDYTDDTRVMYEHYGFKPHFLDGAENLFKVTYPGDVFVLEKLMEKYGV